jgi:hypothetical protein
MTYDSAMMIWVSDLDDYIDVDAINRANQEEAEQDQLDHELEEIGDLQLLPGRRTSARQLNWKGVSPSDWRHAVHKAEMTIGTESFGGFGQTGICAKSPESRFVRLMFDLGRSYAVARYARWERLDYPSAVTATLPHGMRALINQFLSFEAASRSPSSHLPAFISRLWSCEFRHCRNFATCSPPTPLTASLRDLIRAGSLRMDGQYGHGACGTYGRCWTFIPMLFVTVWSEPWQAWP